MKLYKYPTYDAYVSAQVEANKAKLHWQWVRRENIELICKHIGRFESVLCHGTRRGLEQQYFKEITGCKALGTEISPTATDFPDTVQWDFNKQRPSWVQKWDVVYSNSLDHSPDPELTVGIWVQQARKCVVLERDKNASFSTEWDPFGATEEEWEAMFAIREKIKGNGTTIYII